MKVLAVLALIACVAAGAVAAATTDIEQTPEELSVEVLSVIDQANSLAEDAAKALVQQYEVIYVGPTAELNSAVEAIEVRRDDHPHCVAAEDENIDAILGVANSNMLKCGYKTGKECVEITIDVTKACKQLGFDGYNLYQGYQRCQSINNTFLRNSCMTRWSISATIFMVRARSSIRTIRETRQRVPQVFRDSKACTSGVANHAIENLDGVNRSIDTCVGFARRR